ncbi:methyltransferase-like protein 27 isoform X1 [Branchiostoma lanceolatum]|uniref:methyltransferase-like protein 27 isoform X1 n=1 Tax=Branchiostoma lanceolatum TaxID=7740 RepID=UPI0034547807
MTTGLRHTTRSMPSWTTKPLGRCCAETLAEKLAGTDRRKFRILDVAAGTGLAGEELQKIGFTNMDAVDCSQKMLDEAKAKNIYGRLICDFVGPDQLDIQNGMIRYG